MKKVVIALLVMLSTSATSFAQWNGLNEGLSAGYKGFVDLGYIVDLSDYEAGRLELTTSHGYQFNPYFFAGAGIGLDYYTDAELISVPLFANVRVTPTLNKISPYIDVKLGYSVADVEGLYFTPTVGCRFGLTDRIGLNVGVGYAMQGATISYYGYGYYDEESEMVHGLSIKVGLDF